MVLKTILILAPHTDDAEFGMGASISKFLRLGHMVHICAFSSCEESVPKEFPKTILRTEFNKSMETFGIIKENRTLFNYPVRNFDQNRQDILDDLIALRKQIMPDMVFFPNLNDQHQDHFVIAKEAVRAFSKTASCVQYSLPWNMVKTNHNLVIPVLEADLHRQAEAIDCYASQKFRSYNANTARISAAHNGYINGVRFAEVFEVYKMYANE